MRDTDCKLVDGRRQKPTAKTVDRLNLRRLSQNALVRARGGRSARSHSASRPSGTAYRHGRACSTLRVLAKLAMGSCPDGNLEIWPVTGSAVTSVTSGHGEEALRIGKGARSTRGSAAWQRYLKAKHARHVLGALRSPRLMFLLCEDQPLE